MSLTSNLINDKHVNQNILKCGHVTVHVFVMLIRLCRAFFVLSNNVQCNWPQNIMLRIDSSD